MTIEEFKKMNNTSGKVYYFGGSFDPVTIAHEEIFSYLKSIKKKDDIILVGPNSNGYHFRGKSLTDINIRLEMLNSVIDKSFIILDSPDKFEGTINILNELNHPIYVIGSDSLHSIHEWVSPEELVKNNKFLVFERTGYSIDILNSDELLKKYKNNFEIAHCKISDVSSSNVRCGNLDGVSENIIKIIEKYNLYKR